MWGSSWEHSHSPVNVLWLRGTVFFHVKCCTFKPHFPLVPVSFTLLNCLASSNILLFSLQAREEWTLDQALDMATNAFHHSKENDIIDQMILSAIFERAMFETVLKLSVFYVFLPLNYPLQVQKWLDISLLKLNFKN